jgi:DNA-binding transcriptional ArsR family regulator
MTGKHQKLTPDTVFKIESLETLKVVSDPFRQKIMECLMDEPKTVKQLAAELDTPATKLYYHINQLEEHKLVKVTGTRVVSGIIEKFYLAAAIRFEVERSLLDFNSEGATENMISAFTGLFESTLNEMQDSFRQGLLGEEGKDKGYQVVISRALAELTKEQLEDFSKQLKELVEKFNNIAAGPSAEQDIDKTTYGLTVTFYPTLRKNNPSKPDETDF